MVTSASPPASIALEVSALRRGAPAESSYIDFVVSACSGAGQPDYTRWSLTPIRRATSTARVVRRPAARFATLTRALGRTVRSERVASRGDVVHLASGPLPIAVAAPGVVSIHRGLDVAASSPSSRDVKRVRELLVRAAGEGVVVHATTTVLAEELVTEWGIPRERVVVAHPGVATSADRRQVDGGPSVLVAKGDSAARDASVVAALRESNEVSVGEWESTSSFGTSACVVVTTSHEQFPTVAIEAMAAGCAVVAFRTPTNGALLGGAARLVDQATTAELVDAAIDLVRDDAARSVTVTAGHTRAADFSVRARTPDLLNLYARAMNGSGN
jgi:Glycosyl transferases group 1